MKKFLIALLLCVMPVFAGELYVDHYCEDGINFNWPQETLRSLYYSSSNFGLSTDAGTIYLNFVQYGIDPIGSGYLGLGLTKDFEIGNLTISPLCGYYYELIEQTDAGYIGLGISLKLAEW